MAISGVLYGTALALTKIATQAGVTPLGYVFCQCFGAMTVLGVLCGVCGQTFPMTRRALIYCCVCAVTGIVLPNLLLLLLVARLPVSTLAVVVVTMPLFTFLFAVAAGVEPMGWRRLAGIVLGFAGALGVMAAPLSSALDTDWRWSVAAFGIPMSVAVCHLFAARYPAPQIDAPVRAWSMMTAATLFLGLIALGLGEFPIPLSVSGTGQAAVAGQIVISSVTYLLYFVILKRSGPVYFSQVSYILTLTGVVWGYLFFSESLNASFLLGMCGVLLAIGMVGGAPERGVATGRWVTAAAGRRRAGRRSRRPRVP